MIYFQICKRYFINCVLLYLDIFLKQFIAGLVGDFYLIAKAWQKTEIEHIHFVTKHTVNKQTH